jgi:hypothetical protein
MNAIENRAPGRQARQAHPRESDAAPIQCVARRENGMEERFFKITNDLDRFCHASYTQSGLVFSGALSSNDLRVWVPIRDMKIISSPAPRWTLCFVITRATIPNRTNFGLDLRWNSTLIAYEQL